MIKLENLPFEKNSLIPYISEETIEYHYGKHHMAYVDNLNKLIAGSEFDSMPLEDIIKKSNGAIFNNAAQAWNHNFYWNNISPNGGGEPDGKIKELIEDSFGNFLYFKTVFSDAAKSNFGSGWTWLVENNEGKLEIISTSNADTPIRTGKKPLLVIDIWEHAYYIDYRNARPKYIENFWNIINWETVNSRL